MVMLYNFKLIDNQLLSTLTLEMLNKSLYFQWEEGKIGVLSHSLLYPPRLGQCRAH